MASKLRSAAAFLAGVLVVQLLTATPAAAAAPPAPTGLTAAATHSFNSHLTWTDNSGGTAQYIVNNGTADSKTLGAGTTAYDWGGQSPNTYLCFTVRAVTSGGTSPSAGPVCTTTPAATCGTTQTTADASGFVDFYHGTAQQYAQDIRDNGIDISKGNPDTDFGRGFYITTDLRQSQEWATKNFSGQTPTVVHFRIARSNLTPSGLCGLVFPGANADFFLFVRWIRDNLPPMGGAGYDFVEGPLLLNPSKFLAGQPPVTDGQQDSIHSTRAAAVFNAGYVELLPVPPVRLMIVGDSISQGSAGDFTWRYRFYNHETAAAGVNLDLVGPRDDLFDNVANAWNDNHTYADPNFDQDHDAVWGRSLANGAAAIQADVSAFQPDYLLVLLGINDLSWGVSDPAGTEASLRLFIANARAANPGIRMVFGSLLPNTRMATDGAYAAAVADYNSRLAATVASLSTTQSPMVIADDGADFVAANDTWDGTHPNAAGEVKIAAAFADALADKFYDHSHGPGFGIAYPRPYPSVPLGPQTQPQLSAVPGDGQATLTWTLSPGATGYYVYVKNVTAGETAFTKLPYAVPGPSWVAGLLVNGATYEFQLGATKGTAEGVKSNVVAVTPTVATPAGVTDLTAAPGDHQATLSWTPVANAAGYQVYVKNVTAGETSFTQLPWPVAGPIWVAGLLSPGATYQFQLQSVNGLIRGGMSNVASVTISGTTPAAVTNLTATGGDHQATLSWSQVADATGYYVYVKNVTAGETSFTQLPIPVPGPSWTAGLLQAGATYQFQVQSVNGYLRGGMSNVATAAVTGATPAGVTDLTAAPGNDAATLSWTKVANATGYYVYVRNVSAGEDGFTQLPWPVSGPSWTAGLLQSGATYQFKLQSVDDLIRGGFSNTVTVVIGGPTPGGVTNLTATPGNRQATLSWTNVANATGYYVYVRNVSAGESDFTQLPIPVPGPSWVASGLVAGAQYQFKLQSVNDLIRGGFSNTATVTVTGTTPGGATLSVTAGNRQATLSWSLVASATGYYVYVRNVSAGESGFTKLPYAVAGPSWVASGLVAGAQYQFKLQSVNGLILGGFSNTVSVTVSGTTPGGVTDLTAAAGNRQATLRWTEVANATGYYVYVRNVSAGESGFTQLPYAVSGSSWVASGLVAGAQYQFKLQSVNGLIRGGYSNTVSVTPTGVTPAGPTNLTATPGDHKATLRWTEAAYATGYYVYVRNVSAGESGFTQLPYAVSGSSWIAGALVPGGQYEFKLQSVNGLIRGGYSNTVSVIAGGVTPAGVTDLSGAAGDGEVKLSWTRVANATGYYVHVKDVTAGQTSFTELPYAVPGPTWTAGMLINDHTYQFQLQSINGLLRGGLSNIVAATPHLPPIPPAGRTASVTTGWIHAGTSYFEYTQLYDVTGRISGYRSGSTMSITQHWDTNGKHLYDGIFYFQLWDCTIAAPGDPVSGTPAWTSNMAYEDNPSITSATTTVNVAINPQHYYVLRVTGGGDYDSQIWGKSGSFAPSIPPFTDLIRFDARTNCF